MSEHPLIRMILIAMCSRSSTTSSAPSAARTPQRTSVLRRECGAYVRRPGGWLARPTREGYRVVCRPRRMPRGAALAAHIGGEFPAQGTTHLRVVPPVQWRLNLPDLSGAWNQPERRH
jgi:hypothetical protein